MKQKIRVAVALGSNLGEREKVMGQAVERLKEDLLEESRLSSMIETEPWGIKDQPQFLNAVIVGWSEWKPPAILNYLKSLERELGRTQTYLNGPRVIDLDLICYGELVWDSEGVQVPHPRMFNRDFVLRPLCEIWPNWTHPILKKTASELLSAL
ncbi:MAG: 2-amino-4-hydroxy-6-hydroxymethyldihydropteridine diphosphokinase [Deltaproteobacteria bacterium]